MKKLLFLLLLLLLLLLLFAAMAPAEYRLVEDEFDNLNMQIGYYREIENAVRQRLSDETFRQDAIIAETDSNPVDIVLRRTAALLDNIKRMPNSPDMGAHGRELAKFKKLNTARLTEDQQRKLFKQITALRRQIAFKNPLLDFDKIIFATHHKQTYGEKHMVDQHLGFNAGKGGGIYILENPFSNNAVVKDILANSVVSNGRYKGKALKDGSFISLDLDYNAGEILFAWTQAQCQVPEDASYENQYWTKKESEPYKGAKHYHFRPESVYHIFKANADGTNLVQLTDGMYNDFDPCFMPNGKIVFISARAGGELRCGMRPLPTTTLFAMMADGSDMIQLSWHETNEWHPSIDNNGMIVYSRWDYVDRDSDIAHHIWHTFPDGRDPRSYHGNYPKTRESRPWMELSIRAIPNSTRYVATAAPHHGENYGSFVMIDIAVEDDGGSSQLKRITPEAHWPEAEKSPGIAHKSHKGRHSPAGEYFGQAWPLSEDYYLCVYSPKQDDYDLCLIDSFGNREVLLESKRMGVACLDPIPLKSRKRPPIIPTKTMQARADRSQDTPPATGIVTIMNIYESEYPWPKDTKITELRIVNIFPKTNPFSVIPMIGVADQSLARGVLGTVPVEADGSVHFIMPAGAPVYFQALDENGLAIQTMRSDTYIHPGETLSCIGCHEPKNKIMSNARKMPAAMQRSASKIKPEVTGSYPLTFPRLVQPVLDAKCVKCHEEKKACYLGGDQFGEYGWSRSYNELKDFGWGKKGGNGAIAENGLSYSIPGQVGARVSRLYTILTKDHYGVKLSKEEMRRITMWIDCNTVFYGAYVETKKQSKGEIVKPKWGVPRWIDFEELAR